MFSCLLISFGDQNPSACFVSTGARLLVAGQPWVVVLDGGAGATRGSVLFIGRDIDRYIICSNLCVPATILHIQWLHHICFAAKYINVCRCE